jgi:CheY-like chemotaxis protein
VELALAEGIDCVRADAGQIEQVVMNLAVNARDAMPKGGTLTLETGLVTADEDFSSRHPDLPRGPLVCLSVRDTGCGMADEVKAHLFEPFFTTKGKGKGTGLGLAMVYGIIKQSGGAIEVESAPNGGTAFRIYLPQTETETHNKDMDKDEDEDEDEGRLVRGHETILLVEDEEIVRRLGERVLTANGYTVLTAVNGSEALKVLERHAKPVDLLVTDVVMPGMSGRELARALASKDMVRRTLFVSGYTDDAIVRHGVLEPGLAFLYKPFSPDVLLRKLREVLDGPADKARA